MMILKACMLICLLILLSFGTDGANLVRTLPGFAGELPFKLETGYVGVGEFGKIQLYYYFVESQRDPMKDPLILWNTGGPGCSGLSGFFYEFGPLRFDYQAFNGSLPKLKLNPDTLTQVANMIFLDAPVGTGFSYSETDTEYFIKDDIDAADANYQFLQKWLVEHPKFLNNSLYIAGSSYGGKIVAILVHQIHTGQMKKQVPNMNLQGYFLGNPATDAIIENISHVLIAHRLALISDELYESAKVNCGDEYLQPDIKSALCLEAEQAIQKCTNIINREQVLEPNCGSNDFILERTLTDTYVTINDVVEVFQGKKQWCRKYNYVLSEIWANDPGVQDALNIRKGTKNTWKRCNMTIVNGYPTNIITSVVDYHRSFFNTGYRALVYSGDHDMLVPYLSSEEWISSLNLTVSDPWRPWIVDNQAAGYTRTYNYQDTYELTFATVKGASHTAPDDKAKPCFEMLDRWLSHSKL